MNLTTGPRLSGYTILSRLGAGGMGEVYRAHDSRLGRAVAVKVLTDEPAADRGHLKRFTLEGRAITALNHPNIITVYDVAEADGFPDIATELVEGETLRDRLARGPLTVREAVDIGLQIAEGLAHAHDARIVRRDLKPQNVMVKPDGLVKILDFGLGKILPVPALSQAETATTFGATPTTAGMIRGTAGYMSPEQVTGRPVDGRSDQFAFGALVYELLTGRRAFHRDTTIETISSVLNTDPPPLRTVAPTTPAPLVQTVERCLAKDPANRYDSTHDLVHDLRAVQHELMGSKSRSRLRPVPVRRSTAIPLGTVLALLIIRGLSTQWFVRSRPAAPK